MQSKHTAILVTRPSAMPGLMHLYDQWPQGEELEGDVFGSRLWLLPEQHRRRYWVLGMLLPRRRLAWRDPVWAYAQSANYRQLDFFFRLGCTQLLCLHLASSLGWRGSPPTPIPQPCNGERHLQPSKAQCVPSKGQTPKDYRQQCSYVDYGYKNTWAGTYGDCVVDESASTAMIVVDCGWHYELTAVSMRFSSQSASGKQLGKSSSGP
jgi:hypothetical protein